MSEPLLTKSGHVPAPRGAVVRWLLAPTRSIGPEGDAELRQSLLRRLEAVLVSAAVTLFVAATAFVEHPAAPFAGWLLCEVTLAAIRIPLVIRLLRFSRGSDPRRALPPWIIDAFVCAGTVWSALLGFGTGLCVATSDPGLSILAALTAMGTVGAQGARNPGSPRLNCLQMGLIVLPFSAGTLFSDIPLARATVLLTPLYLSGMISITRQLHADYVALWLAQMQNRARALHCPLTGLPNRAHFEEALTVALSRAADDRRSVLMMYVDLDGFKVVNDQFGHAAGDALLVEVAGRLRDWGRSQALVARLGGDEFAVLLSTDDGCRAELDARAVIDTIQDPCDLGVGRSVRIGATVGLAASARGMTPATLTGHADAALYQAKRSGKGTFRWYDDVLPVQAHATAA